MIGGREDVSKRVKCRKKVRLRTETDLLNNIS